MLFNWKGLFKNIADKHNKRIKDVEKSFFKHDLLSCKGVIQTTELWRRMINDLDIKSSIEDFHKLSITSFYPIRETHDYIKFMQTHLSIGLLTNIHHGFLAECLSSGYIPDIEYSAVIESCKIKMVKPDPEIYKYAQKKAKVKNENIFFIDDQEENIKGAKKAGWQAVLFDTFNPVSSIKNIKKYMSDNK